jgi:NADH-quinone oxidoreductase subunit C
LQDRFPGQVTAADLGGRHPHATIAASVWLDAAKLLRDDPDLAFDFLRCLSAVDYPKEAKLVCVYDFISTTHRHAFAVKVAAAHDNPHVPSVAGIWPTANWHEREAYDLFGIVYDGTPTCDGSSCPKTGQAIRFARTTSSPRPTTEFHARAW